jgi:hypothetical protein
MTWNMLGTIFAGALTLAMSAEVNATIRPFAKTVSGAVNLPAREPPE